MCEAFRMAIVRATKQPPFTPRYTHNFPDWGHNVANELIKTVFKGIVGMAPKGNESNETVARKAGQLVGVAIRAAIFYWKEAPAQIERDGLNKLTKEQEEKLEKCTGWELLLPQASELAGRPITNKAELIQFYRRRIMHIIIQLVRTNLVLIKLILHRAGGRNIPVFEWHS